jgi:hypothetical protein
VVGIGAWRSEKAQQLPEAEGSSVWLECRVSESE